MSDVSIFGPVAYRLPYKEAVEKRFLCDYRIIAIGVDERAWTAANRIVQQFEQSQESRGLTTREALSWLVYGVTLAGGVVGDDGRLRVSRSLAFLNKVQRSGQMVKWLASDEGRSEIERYFAEGGFGGAGRRYAVEHLDAGHPVRERRRALRDLAGADGENPRGGQARRPAPARRGTHRAGAGGLPPHGRRPGPGAGRALHRRRPRRRARHVPAPRRSGRGTESAASAAARGRVDGVIAGCSSWPGCAARK